MASLFQRADITDSNYSPINNILTWIMLISICLAVLVKIVMKAVYSHSFGTDDAILGVALLFGASQSVAASIQIFNGVGHRLDSLGTSQIHAYERAGYASGLLLIVTIAVSKIAVLVLLRQITPVVSHRRLTLGVGTIITIWSVSSLIAGAFQCRLPDAWKIIEGHCFNQISFWKSFAIVNILTEMALLALPTYVMWAVHMNTHRKLTVIGCFSFRTSVIGAAIAQVVLLDRLENTNDITFDIWSYHLTTQFVVSLSIITVCIPYVRNVLLGFESGMFQTGGFRLGKLMPAKNSKPDGSPDGAPKDDGTDEGSTLDGTKVYAGIKPGVDGVQFESNRAVAEATSPDEQWDDGSESSQAQIIRTTREWTVDYDNRMDAMV